MILTLLILTFMVLISHLMDKRETLLKEMNYFNVVYSQHLAIEKTRVKNREDLRKQTLPRGEYDF